MGSCCCSGESKKKEKERKPPFSRNNVCCTDILPLLLFVAFLGLMVYMAVYSIMRGDARRLLFGYDSFGNTCDQDNTGNPIANISHSGMDTSGHQNVFFFDVFDPFNAMQVCVTKCPTEDLKTKEQVKKFAEETGSKLCRYDIPVEDYLDQEFGKQGPCPSLPIFESASVLYRCAPDPLAFASNDMDPLRKNATIEFYKIFGFDDIFRKVLSDFYSSWREIIVLCVVAVVIAFVMVLLMRFLASVIVWMIVILAAIGSIAGTAFLWWTYYQTKQDINNNESLDIPILGIEIDNELAFLVFSIIATVLTVILLLILLVMRKRISLVVALFHEAGKCLANMPFLLIQPLWTFIILAAFLVYWVIVLAYISTTGYPTADYEKGFVSVKYVLEGVASHFWWIHLIGLIWVAEFILACQQFVIAGATANWFFTRNKGDLTCPIGKSICRLILHHIGSVAFGSLIILIVKIPRYILMYIQAKTEGSENSCAKCCIKCCICCLWCLEKVLKFLNQNAYTIIAIDGTSFCSAAQKAFSIIANNVLRVAAINSVGAFVLFLGKIGVMAATCAVSVVWLKEGDLHFYAIPVLMVCVFSFLFAHCLMTVYESLPDLHYYAIPVLLLCIFSFLIAHCFLSVYEMVIDALLLCFCEDTALNDGVSPGKDYYMSASLMEFVKTSSRQLEAMKGRQKDYVDGTEDGRELQEMRA